MWGQGPSNTVRSGGHPRVSLCTAEVTWGCPDSDRAAALRTPGPDASTGANGAVAGKRTTALHPSADGRTAAVGQPPATDDTPCY